MIKKILFIVISSLFIASPILAQSPTGDIRDAVQRQVQQELSNIKQAVAKKGFVGNITAKTEAGLTLTNLKNQPRTVLVTGDTTIKLLGGGDGTLSGLKINDFILVMGNVDSTNKMTASRLLVIKQPDADKRDSKFGTITKVTSSSVSLGDLTVKVSSTTAYTKISDAKVVSAKLTDFKIDSKIIVVGTPGTTANSFTATDIHLVP